MKEPGKIRDWADTLGVKGQVMRMQWARLGGHSSACVVTVVMQVRGGRRGEGIEGGREG